MTQPDDPFDFTGYGRQSAGTGAGSSTVGGFDPRPNSGAASGGSVRWGFDDNTGSSFADSEPVAGPPVLWLAAVGAAAAVGLIVAAVFGAAPVMAFVGWILCGPIAIGLLAAFTVADTRRRAKPVYSQPEWVRYAYRGGFLVSLTGVALAAWRIADWAGRL
ncbi:hypothetical protein M2280_005358 [Prescottella agglutinans]|uniref:Uncharacterized protein n=1 Tax=Prescottella agglutinans TaxID=1644129 RepID=A0ABT6MJX3_9NOCA|nr:hypothetical protein [Prescottella agglutinans]